MAPAHSNIVTGQKPVIGARAAGLVVAALRRPAAATSVHRAAI